MCDVKLMSEMWIKAILMLRQRPSSVFFKQNHLLNDVSLYGHNFRFWHRRKCLQQHECNICLLMENSKNFNTLKIV